MRSPDDILTRLRAVQPALRDSYRIRSMGVFGSYASGEQRDGSDIDVPVELDGAIDLIAYAGLQIELSDALGVPVDLVEREALRPRLANRVLAEVVQCNSRSEGRPWRYGGVRHRKMLVGAMRFDHPLIFINRIPAAKRCQPFLQD